MSTPNISIHHTTTTHLFRASPLRPHTKHTHTHTNMSHLPYTSYPTFGTRTLATLHTSQSVRVGSLIEISGQGGWDPLTEVIPTSLGDEIDGAFRNVQLALTTAGGKGWEGVYKIRVYVSLREGEEGWDEYGGHVVRNLWRWCPVSGYGRGAGEG